MLDNQGAVFHTESLAFFTRGRCRRSTLIGMYGLAYSWYAFEETAVQNPRHLRRIVFVNNTPNLSLYR